MQVDQLYLAALLLVLVTLYYWITRNNGHFRGKPIPAMPVIPIVGNTWPLLFRKTSFVEFLRTIYDRYADVKVFGMFDLSRPVLVIRDPELIKQLSIKDFASFMDRCPLVGNGTDRDHPNLLANKTLLLLTGQRWRNIRTTMSSSFTGSKMRQMFALVMECSENVVRFHREDVDRRGSQEYEVKDLFSRYVNDSIAACAYGLKVDSFRCPNNEFYVNGRKIVDAGGFSAVMRGICHKLFPTLMIRLGVDVIDSEVNRYISSLTASAVKERSERGFVINQLIRSNKNLSDTELAALLLNFLGAGLDSVATCLQFLCYELAINSEVQQKLYEEVERTYTNLEENSLRYEDLQKLNYLDMVVSETLRKWPPAPAIDRLCVKDYQLDDGNDLKFQIDNGTVLWLPIYAMHHDPKYFREPEKFDPERFSDTRKGDIVQGTYLPFGIGPRSCIGTRFALMQVKMIVFFVVKNFLLERSEKTEVPIVLAKGINMFPEILLENGVYLRFRLRN